MKSYGRTSAITLARRFSLVAVYRGASLSRLLGEFVKVAGPFDEYGVYFVTDRIRIAGQQRLLRDRRSCGTNRFRPARHV